MTSLPANIKNICIFGTGGVGGYFGGRIAAAIASRPDHAVYFIARGEHLKAIQARGIVVKTPDETISARPALATDDVSRIPSSDLVLLCVKSFDLSQALTALRPQIRPESVIVPLLNGIDICSRIRQVLHGGIVLPACLYLGTHIESPGVIQQSGGNGIIIFGPDSQYPYFTAENVKRFFHDTGIRFDWQTDPRPAIWEKYMFIAAFGLVTALTGLSLGAVTESVEFRLLVAGIMTEIYSIAQAKSIALPADIVATSVAKAHNFPYEARTSYQRDFESARRFNEGDLYGGAILREGRATGVPTPLTASVYKQICSREVSRLS
jgi:2-dehydropantoate 2-reductase